MSRWRIQLLGVTTLWLASHSALVAAQAADFNFAVIGQVTTTANDSAPLAQAIVQSDNDSLAFVVANGFKSVEEPCTDEFYEQRRDLLSSAKNGLILAPAGSDWTECKNAAGHPAAIERLTRLRELFFVDDFSLGASKIPLIRQSTAVKFRSYVENARWEVDKISFATLNLPAQNNHYRMEAGRNSEFEDRLIANRHWLHRTFALAALKKATAVVLICDGDPLNSKRDGFTEIRQQLITLAGKFPGKVLIIHNRLDDRGPRSNTIAWHGNIGELEVAAEWVKVSVKAGVPTRFAAKIGGQ
jgi:hypothetical protein